MHTKHYLHLSIMTALHFATMYILMYAMVNVFGNVYSSLNQVYMAGIMATPMLLLEFIFMRQMYQNKAWNIAIVLCSVALFALFLWGIRAQAAIGDEQFLRSMIPHHAGAILMCEKASIQDPEIKELCRNIVVGQQSEIDWMKAKIDSLKN